MKRYSIEEYKSQIKEFRESIACFARMHMSYMYHMLHNTFVVNNGRIMFKPEVEQFLLGITSNMKLCTFVIKIGIVEHVMSRICRFYGSDSIKYCASHYRDPKFIDSILVILHDASHFDFSTMSYQVRNSIANCVRRYNITSVYELHDSSFYSELLSMCYDFVRAKSNQSVQFQELCDFIKLSSTVQLAQMYHMILKTKCSTGNEQDNLQGLLLQERNIESLIYSSVFFGKYACRVRKAFRHLYAPSDKNPVRTVSGLNIPYVMIQLNSKGIFAEIEHCVNAEKMDFNVFVRDIVRYINKLLSYPREEGYIRADIGKYCAMVSSRYSTMGADIVPSSLH
ncbi:DUF3514 domain-containing protein [Ehrlichia chaffeensis]|uniref:DUF3514 domain-containing protein n=1 Tax=Ehrlichia chaffeensis TaxID=945 RepID=UPI001E3CBD7C|nr:DUF3514 domain-containing protein [Ehrlichia chaffeensis]